MFVFWKKSQLLDLKEIQLVFIWPLEYHISESQPSKPHLLVCWPSTIQQLINPWKYEVWSSFSHKSLLIRDLEIQHHINIWWFEVHGCSSSVLQNYLEFKVTIPWWFWKRWKETGKSSFELCLYFFILFKRWISKEVGGKSEGDLNWEIEEIVSCIEILSITLAPRPPPCFNSCCSDIDFNISMAWILFDHNLKCISILWWIEIGQRLDVALWRYYKKTTTTLKKHYSA